MFISFFSCVAVQTVLSLLKTSVTLTASSRLQDTSLTEVQPVKTVGYSSEMKVVSTSWYLVSGHNFNYLTDHFMPCTGIQQSPSSSKLPYTLRPTA